MPYLTPAEVTREFWRLMATNDFDSVAAVLAPSLFSNGRNPKNAFAAPKASRA